MKFSNKITCSVIEIMKSSMNYKFGVMLPQVQMDHIGYRVRSNS